MKRAWGTKISGAAQMAGHSDVGEDLPGTASVAMFGRTEALLLAAADAGGDQREQKDDREGMSAAVCGQAEDEGEQDSRERGPDGDGAKPQASRAKAMESPMAEINRGMANGQLWKRFMPTSSYSEMPADGQDRKRGRCIR